MGEICSCLSLRESQRVQLAHHSHGARAGPVELTPCCVSCQHPYLLSECSLTTVTDTVNGDEV